MYLNCSKFTNAVVRSKCKMLKCFLLLVGIVCIPLVLCLRGLILGPGRWLVLHMGHCEDQVEYPMVYEVTRKKINRTHDCFDAHMIFDRDVNTSFSIQIDVFQEVDGGFKFYETIKDDNYCAFLMRHAGENMRRGLTLAHIDPPECPFLKGEVIMKNFVMDYRELAKHGVYGTFLANLYFIYEDLKYTCVQTILNFDEYESDYNDEEEEEDDDDDEGVIGKLL
ncbi:uncharacterized protein LOC110379774 [Helicoverpa armigera]|uniref:uncharacterized protein LOC110379774 n=1 Tax=Helicoverpa armigera TaxID=29058 RepID=UPI003082EB60